MTLKCPGTYSSCSETSCADLAQPAAARRAAAGAAGRIGCASVASGRWTCVLARQVRGQLALEPAPLAASGFARRLGRRSFIQWFAFDQRELRVLELLAGAAELRTDARAPAAA